MVMFTFVGFRPKIPFLDKFGPKIQNCLFKVKFGARTVQNSIMQNSTVIFIFFVFYRKLLLFGKFDPHIKNCLFKVKLGTQTNSNM